MALNMSALTILRSPPEFITRTSSALDGGGWFLVDLLQTRTHPNAKGGAMRNWRDLNDRLVPNSVAARTLGVSTLTLWRWRKQGLLPAPHRINGRAYQRQSDLDAIIEGRGRTATR